MDLQPHLCYRAVQARDARYDGRFFTCVKTTGIYCRPICPARPPKLENCQFVPTAAAAQELGFRPCLRCRPESSPTLTPWRGTEATVSRAWKLIEAGALDEGNVAQLAARLGVSDRQLRRLFREYVGASPVSVAQTRRVLLAKQLLHQTTLSMIDVAYASGFGSLRRFNETFQQLYQRPPSDIRRRTSTPLPSPELSILLPYQPPYDWEAILRFFRARAIDGVEIVTDTVYRRVIELNGAIGTVEVAHAPTDSALRATIRISDLSSVPLLITRLRRQFDLGADPQAIAEVLSRDALLASAVRARPGLRVPGGWDGFEIGVRAVLGQQITVTAATRLAARFAAALGSPVPPEIALEGFRHVFPRPEQVQRKVLNQLGLTQARLETLIAVAQGVRGNPQFFDPRRDLSEAVSDLRELRGIGEWTAQYIAMRAMGESDAFLAGDAGLQRQLIAAGTHLSMSQLLTRAEQWRPWRAYALQYLWNLESVLPGPVSLRKRKHAIAT